MPGMILASLQGELRTQVVVDVGDIGDTLKTLTTVWLEIKKSIPRLLVVGCCLMSYLFFVFFKKLDIAQH